MFRSAHSRFFLAIGSVFSLAGCAVGTEPVVSHVAVPVARPSEVALQIAGPEGEAVSPQSRRFIAMLGEALAARGLAAGEGGYRIQVALARRPATAGAAHEGADKIDWLALPRKKRWLESCKPDVVEVRLLGFDKGQTVQQASYRASGGFLACRPSEEQMHRLAELFAADFSQR